MGHNSYQLTEVITKKQIKEFLHVPVILYKNDENWIRPLDRDIEKVFDPRENRFFKNGDAIRWIIRDEKDHLVGRLAAFYENDNIFENEQPTGGIGFFECVNNQKAANLLFDTGKEWLKGKGMTAMDGPVNFGMRDYFWGCLSEGFHEPIYNMPYNHPYYCQLFENYGFKNYFNQYTYQLNLLDGVKSQVVKEKAARLLKRRNYSFETFDRKKADKYAEDIMHIHNLGWSKFPGVPKMTKLQAGNIIKELKPILDTRAIIFGYHHEEPVGFYVMIPDLFQVIRNFNGKFNLYQKLRLLFDLKIGKKANRLIGVIFGVVPEHQGRGVEAGLVMRMEQEIFKPGFPYKNLEMNWIGDFNPGMMKMVEQIGGRIYKKHVTYRYLFDQTLPFHRAKVIS